MKHLPPFTASPHFRTLALFWLALCFLVTDAHARPYGDWKNTHFGVNATNPLIAGETADPDKDGWSNAVEYAMDTDPLAPTQSLWQADSTSGTLLMTFERQSYNDLNLFVEVSTDLAPLTWQLVGQSTAGAPFAGAHPDFGINEQALGGGRFKVTVKEGNTSDRRLFRVRAVPAVLTGLAVAPLSSSLPIGLTQNFTATATYSDGFSESVASVATWSSSSPSTASISNATSTQGLATALNLGNCTMTATYGGLTATGNISVTPAVLVTLTVTPSFPTVPLGATQQFTATGTFSDSSNQNLTAQVTWSSSDTLVGTVSNASGTEGSATAVAQGTAIISATMGTVTGSTKMQVAPAALVSLVVTPGNPASNVGQTRQFTATGTFTDNTSQDITTQVTWSSSNSTMAVISNASGSQGLATAVSTGNVTITATLGAVAGSTNFSVLPAALASISVTPANAFTTVGLTQQFTATGIYTDSSTQNVTTQVTWSSSSSGIVTVSNASGSEGLATATAVGSSTISATLGIISGSTLFTVNPPPAVVATTPVDGGTGVSPGTTISITFNQAMNPATLTAQNTIGAAAGTILLSHDNFATCMAFTGSPIMSSGNTVATLTLAPALMQGTTWKIRVLASAANAQGNTIGTDFTQPLGFTTAVDARCGTGLVISQIYGGGGNTGSVYKNDFIEIHNPTGTAISTAGHAVQYASATGTTWQVTTLPTVSIPAGGYFLIQEAAGTGGTTNLPTPDAIGTIAMSGTAGKVALTNTTTALTGSAPVSAAMLDLVGFGATANGFETAPTPAPSNTNSVLRKGNGNTDENNNSTDFVAGLAAPRNSLATAALGNCTANETNQGYELDYVALNHPPSISGQVGTSSPTIFAQVYEFNTTEAPGAAASMRCEIGYGPVTANPQNQPGWTWVPASYNSQVGNNDEYQANLTLPNTPGNYRYTARFSLDGTNWTYADSDGAGSNAALFFELERLNVLTVTP